MSLIGVGNLGNFNLWSIFWYLETRFACLVGGCKADSMAHLKQALSEFLTFTIAFFNCNFSGRGMYEDPFNGWYLPTCKSRVSTFLKTHILPFLASKSGIFCFIRSILDCSLASSSSLFVADSRLLETHLVS